MNDSLHNLETIREYLLGRITDENTLEGLEALLFTDDDFCQKAEIIEDELINDFVFGKLSGKDTIDFEKTLENNSDRRAKIQVTQALKTKLAEKIVEEKISILDSIRAFFRQPVYAGAFALLLIVILIGAILIFRPSSNSELAELKNIYKDNRPFETRLSEFDYAPYQVTRGEENLTDAEKRKLRLVETKLLEAVDKNPNAANHHSLGVFYLTQAKYAESIKELELAVKFNDQNHEFHNSLGSAYFEFGKFEKENKLLNIAKANESFSKSLELNPNFLEALFNKSLALQTLNLPRQAKESWELYLQKDSTSKWADEARKNLEKIAQMQSSFKTKEQVLDDFLTAYRKGDEEFAWKINSQTKEMISGVWLPDQLSRRYLAARKNKDETTAKESIEALTYIGKLEHVRNADFFVRDLADYYSNVGDDKVNDLLRAKELISDGLNSLQKSMFRETETSLTKSKLILKSLNNNTESLFVEFLVAQALKDLDKIEMSLDLLLKLEKTSNLKSYQWLKQNILSWLAIDYANIGKFSKSKNSLQSSIKLSKINNDTFGLKRNISLLVELFLSIGEVENSQKLQSEIVNIESLYFSSAFQNWRTYQNSSQIFFLQNLRNGAVESAREALYIAKLEIKNLRAEIGSLDFIYTSLQKKDDFLVAEKYVIEAKVKLDEMPESPGKTLDIASIYLKLANGKFINNEFVDALNDYQTAIDLSSKNEEIQLYSFEAQKGKLLCLKALSRKNEFNTELGNVIKLTENHRKKILDEEYRNVFFDNQQVLYDLAIENSLENKEYVEAFEFAEKSKARTLLDFVSNDKKVNDNSKVKKPFTLTEIQRRMPDDLTIVEYAVLRDRLVIWVIKKNDFQTFENLISENTLEKLVDEFLTNLVVFKKNINEISASSNKLYNQIISPISSNLRNIDEISFILDKSLAKIPMATLLNNENRYLIEDFSISYSPSSSVLIVTTENSYQKENLGEEKLLSIGNPSFDIEENRSLQNLQSAETEATEISLLYEKHTLLLQEKADKKTVLEGLHKNNIFHFAGHYVSNKLSSRNSKFLLTPKDLETGELRLHEIFNNLSPKMKLVVLSACQTANEQFYKGEGSIGAVTSFLSLGVPIVIGSLWKVDTESTKDLFIDFHTNRKKNGLKVIESLRQSQLKMLKGNNEEFRKPYYWGAFFASGGVVNY